MYSAFQAFAFQTYAFQVADNDNGWLGGGLKDKYTYSHPFIEYQNRQARLKKEKTDLEKLESVLAENKRKIAIIEKSKQEAEEAQLARLAKLELEYLQEINRLVQVRALLLLRIKQNEEAMIVLLAMMRRRMRA